MTRPPGYPIVLTADRVLMADYAVLFDGMLAASQTTRVPGLAMRGLIAPRMPNRDGRAIRAPLGLRRVEAALLNDGFDPDEVAIVAPEDLHRAIGPATRLVGVSSGDPLGLGMNNSTMEGIAGGKVHLRRWFPKLLKRIGRLRRKHAFRVVLGGPGAWQVVQHPEARDAFGIDAVAFGYVEGDIAEFARRALDDGALPPLLEGRFVEPDTIPAIRGPSSMGAVEISRGCGRGCGFCTIRNVPMRHLPIETIVADVETNVRSGVRNVALLGEDFFRYGGAGGNVCPDALVDLARSVRRIDGVRLIQIDHAGVAAVMQLEPQALREVRNALTNGVRHDFVWLNLGVETASGHLLAAGGGEPKMTPFPPDRWAGACEDAVHRLTDAGFIPMVSLVMGLPGESPEDVERTITFVDRLRDERVMVFPLFYAPVNADDRPFGVKDMTPAHWRLFRRSYDLNFRWVPRMYWDNRRGAGAPLGRTLLLQAGGMLQTLQWRMLFVLRSGRLRA